ncbi:hypothetical protein Bca52824_050249 [Brassica carinata]|uniref:Uncharacterized protein n=1 Tax=Brassica carinata TaxID=52824 RepID=A0A8X7RKF0_BRACI|nr:hypothetical protein Bca52824_050248 [Brassica carinata]KAG2290645.1 hypothetical protein Bca52824_050249 [Brassica carinata]
MQIATVTAQGISENNRETEPALRQHHFRPTSSSPEYYFLECFNRLNVEISSNKPHTHIRLHKL